MSFRGHMIDAGKNLTKGIIAPFKGIFYTGPQNIKKAYQYEVYGREKVEKRGLFRYKMFAFWRAPGEELKALIDGSVEAVSFGGDAIKNILSAIFSD
jgi:hypothetical protein